MFRAESKADLAFVRRVCHDTLQRGPRPREVRSLVGMPSDRVVRHLLERPEAYEQWVEEELYFHLLIDRFRPRTRAIEELPARLRNGDADVRRATAEILLSTSFSLRNPGNDTFVTVVLEQCLGMPVQDRRNVRTLEAGKELYDGKATRFLGREGRTQADVVRFAIEDERFARRLLDRHRRRLLGEGLDAMDRAEGDALVAEVHENPSRFFDVLARWMAGDAYRSAVATRRPRSDRQFVRALFVDVFDREPNYEELRNVRNALQSMADAAPLRAVLVKLALGSTEAVIPEPVPGQEAKFVRSCFERYLGRSPTQEEEARCRGVLAEPGTSPKTLVRALLSSPEYGFY